MHFRLLFTALITAVPAVLTSEAPPTITCHSNYDVNVIGVRPFIAVQGYESRTDSNCTSVGEVIQEWQNIRFNFISDGCNHGTRIENGIVIISVVSSSTAEFEDAKFDDLSCSLPPAIGSQEGIVIRYSSDEGSPSQSLPNVKFGDPVRLVVDANNAQFHFDSFTIAGCTMFDGPPSSPDVMDFPLIDADGCKATPNSYNPFIDDEDLDGFEVQGKVATTAAFQAFKFPNSHFVLAQCSLVFCNSSEAQLCHQPSCGSSSMKRSSPTSTAATALPVYLDISVVTPIESYQDGANGQNFVIWSQLTTPSPSADSEGCGDKCVILVVVAILLAAANVVAITVIVRKIIAKKNELKVVDKVNGSPEDGDRDDVWSVDKIQGLEKLAPLSLTGPLTATAPMPPSTSVVASSSPSSSSASSVVSDADSARDILPKSRCLSPIESPVPTLVKVYNTYI